MNVAEELARVPLFSDLTVRERRAIARSGKEVSRREGATITREGTEGVGFFLVLDGALDVTRRGRRRARLGPGDFFGELSLIDDGVRTATVTATTPVRLFALTAWTFRALLKKHSAISVRLLGALAGHVRASYEDPATI